MILATRWIFAACAVLSIFSAAVAEAKYPERTVTIVVAAPPGNANDELARRLATKMSERFKQSVIVENKPGAGTTLGAAYVARSKPDGYTLLVTSISLTTTGASFKNPGFDVDRDFHPLGMLGVAPMAVVTNNNIPAKTLNEFVAYAKANPGKLNFGSAGSGSVMHINGELLGLKAGINMMHIPYQGGAPSTAALLANQIQLLVIDVASVLPLVQAGKLRALAVGTPARIKSLPDVPTTVEAGMDLEAVAWYGFFAPRGTPDEVLRELEQQLAEFVSDPAYRREMDGRGWQTPQMKSGEMKARLSAEVAKWREVVKSANIDLQ